MTIGAINRADALGNDSAIAFAYGFKIFAASQLEVVVKKISDGTLTTLTYPTHYSVSGVGSAAGGNVTLTDVDGAWQNASDGTLKSTYSISIRRVVPVTQTTDIRNQGGFHADVHENEFDYLTMIDQQQADDISRSLRFPSNDTGLTATLPAAEARAGKFPVFDASGNVTVSAGTGNDSALRTDLAATGGSALVDYTPPGTGGVRTTVQASIHRTVHVWKYLTAAQIADVESGALTLDVSTALNAFLADVFALRGRGRGRLIGGLYRCNAILTALANGYLEIEGEGKYGSVLVSYATAGSLLKFSGASLPLCAVSRMGFQQNVATTGQLLETDGVFRFDINNVHLNGAPGGTNLAAGLAIFNGTSVYGRSIDGSGFTTFGLKLLNGNDYDLISGTINANGVVGRPLWTDGITGGALNIEAMKFVGGANCLINNTNYGRISSTYFDAAQGGVAVSGCEELDFDICQFANRVSSGSGDGCGIVFGNSKNCTLTGGAAVNCGVDGMQIAANCEGISAIGMRFSDNNTTNVAGGNGATVAAGAQRFAFIGCHGGNGSSLMAGFQRYLIAISAGNSNNYRLIGNEATGNVTGGILDGGTGTAKLNFGNIVDGTPTIPVATGRMSNISIGAVAYGSLGTAVSHVAGTIYATEIAITAAKLFTGVGILNGGTVGTSLGKVGLYDQNGTLIAESAIAGTVSAGANAFQQYPFTATKLVLQPGRYYVGFQANNNTDNIRCVAASTYLPFTISQAGVFSAVASLAALSPVPTAIVADVGPICYLY